MSDKIEPQDKDKAEPGQPEETEAPEVVAHADESEELPWCGIMAAD